MDFLKKAKAVVVGHAIGDALGVPVEFASRDELFNAPLLDMEGFGTYPVPKGSWSDDTSMSLALLDSLANGINYTDIMQKFVEWLNYAKYTPTDIVFDVGNATSKSILLYALNKVPALECGQKSQYDNGNGSLMRIHPIVLYLYDKDITLNEKIQIIYNISALTHAHIRSKIACGIYAFVLWELLKNPSLQSVKDGLDKAEEYYKNEEELKYFERIFSKTFILTKRQDIKSSGYVVDSLEASLWCLLTTSSFSESVLKAVNLGDDTDTIGAITGGLAGALYGYDNIPKKWLNDLIKKDYIETLIKNAFAK